MQCTHQYTQILRGREGEREGLRGGGGRSCARERGKRENSTAKIPFPGVSLKHTRSTGHINSLLSNFNIKSVQILVGFYFRSYQQPESLSPSLVRCFPLCVHVCKSCTDLVPLCCASPQVLQLAALGSWNIVCYLRYGVDDVLEEIEAHNSSPAEVMKWYVCNIPPLLSSPSQTPLTQ